MESNYRSARIFVRDRLAGIISKTLFALFDGLIPEGWLLNIVTQNWKLDAKDRFGLLLVACQDCIGAVSVREVVA